ncbi:MAG TPA: hypothetical protein VMV94_00350 [Phycisphaerae bacterium]|nr:hypothetical protein [Phycisphaerae bacterium]
MPRSIIRYWIASLAVLVILVAATGCDLISMVSNSISFGLGVAFASQVQTTSTDYRCFHNGAEVDCSTLNIDQS